MKTTIEQLAALLASIAWVDEEYDDVDKIAIDEIAEAFKLKAEALNTAVEQEVEKLAKLSEEDFAEYCVAAAQDIPQAEREQVYQAVLSLALSDSILSIDEVNLLLIIAEALEIAPEQAVLYLVDLVKEDPELEIEY